MILSENQRKLLLGSLGVLIVASSLTACGTLSRRDEAENEANPAASTDSGNPTVSQTIAQKDAQIQSLSAQVNELQTQLKAQASAPGVSAPARPVNRQNFDTPLQPSVAASDPERGFVNDGNIQAFRQGKILFDSEKYPEAVLAFSALIERQPSHPLAGVAQFYLAESYYLQNDFESAKVEYQKLIQYYDRSPHISDAYARQAHCFAQTGNVSGANQMRQKVLAFFPNSEAANSVRTEFPERVMNETIAAPSVPTAPVAPTAKLESMERTEAAPPMETAPVNGRDNSALDDVPVTAPESGGNL